MRNIKSLTLLALSICAIGSCDPIVADLFPGRTEVDIFRLGKDFHREPVEIEEEEVTSEPIISVDLLRQQEALAKQRELQEKLKIAEIWGQKTMDDQGRVSYSLPPDYALAMMTAKTPHERQQAYEEYLKIRLEKNVRIGEAATSIQDIAYEKYITPDVFYNDPKNSALKRKHSTDLRNIFVESGPQGRYINEDFKLVDEKDRNYEGKRIPGTVQHPIQVLFFYDIDCPHCNKLMPVIEAFAMQYSDYMDLKGIYVGKDTARMAAYLYHRKESKDPLPFDNYGDTYYKEKDHTYTKSYGVSSWPTVVMINTDKGTGYTIKGSDKNLEVFVKALQSIHKDAQI